MLELEQKIVHWKSEQVAVLDDFTYNIKDNNVMYKSNQKNPNLI